jgi:predicted nucleic acid-binding protein
LQRALGYERLRHRINPEQALDFLEHIEVVAIVVLALDQVDMSSDPDDHLILAAAIVGRVDLIVSGDKPGMRSLREERASRSLPHARL